MSERIDIPVTVHHAGGVSDMASRAKRVHANHDWETVANEASREELQELVIALGRTNDAATTLIQTMFARIEGTND